MKLLRIILENDKVLEMKSEDFLKILEVVNFDTDILFNLPKYSKIKIIGDLNLSYLPISNIDNIFEVTGMLDISNTDIANIEHIKYGTLIFRESAFERKKLREKYLKNIEQADTLRQSEVWNYYNDNLTEEAIKVNAIFRFIIENKLTKNIRTDVDEDELKELKSELKELVNLRSINTNDLTIDEKIDDISDRIKKIEDLMDVYFLSPNGKYWGMDKYVVIDGDLVGRNFVVADEDEFDEGFNKAVRNYIDNIYISDLPDNIINNSINMYYFKDVVDEIIRANYEDSKDDEDAIESDIEADIESALNNPAKFISDYGLEVSKYISTDKLIEELSDLTQPCEYLDCNGGMYDYYLIDGNQYHVFETYN
jgi:hypothetical protein